MARKGGRFWDHPLATSFLNDPGWITYFWLKVGWQGSGRGPELHIIGEGRVLRACSPCCDREGENLEAAKVQPQNFPRGVAGCWSFPAHLGFPPAWGARSTSHTNQQLHPLPIRHTYALLSFTELSLTSVENTDDAYSPHCHYPLPQRLIRSYLLKLTEMKRQLGVYKYKRKHNSFAREKVLGLYSKNYFQLTPSTPPVSKNQFVGYFVA